MKTKPAVFLRRTLLVLLALVVFFTLSEVFLRKTLGGAWNYTLKVGGFFNEPEHSLDLLAFGSSHMYCTLSPVSLYEQTGLRSYVLATQQQPLSATVSYLRKALETQSPDAVVLEALMLVRDSSPVGEGVAHDAVDPFPHGVEKLRLIAALDMPLEQKLSLYLPFYKYHSRYAELGAEDFCPPTARGATDPFHGFVFLTDCTKPAFPAQTDYTGVSPAPLKDSVLASLDEIRALCEAHGTRLLLLVAPYTVPEEEYGAWRAVHDYAALHGVPILDMNTAYDSLPFDRELDFYDSGHLNAYGAAKASAAIGAFAAEHVTFTDKGATDDALWQEDLAYYRERLGA